MASTEIRRDSNDGFINTLILSARAHVAISGLRDALHLASSVCGTCVDFHDAYDSEPAIHDLFCKDIARTDALLRDDFPGYSPLPLIAMLFGMDEEGVIHAVTAGRVVILREMPYQEYLQTEHWKAIRVRLIEAAGGRCRLCNAGNVTLNVHHRTYERRGCELDDDMTVLCQPCHERFHQEGRLSRPE